MDAHADLARVSHNTQLDQLLNREQAKVFPGCYQGLMARDLISNANGDTDAFVIVDASDTQGMDGEPG